MKTAENIEKLIKAFFKAKQSSAAVSPGMDEKVLGDALTAYEKSKINTPADLRPSVWRIIMKSSITKLAVAAIIIVAVVLSVHIFDKSVPTAFGIEQVINAYNNVRFVYEKSYWPNKQVQSEFWMESDQQGNVAKVRGDLRETGDGHKIFVWTPEKTEYWNKRSQTFSISGPSQPIPGWQGFLEESQPKLVMQKLLDDQKAGKVDVDIVKPQDKQKPALIIATQKNKSSKKVYYIDQATDLITCLERYKIEDNKEFLRHTTEISNAPIDEKMFSLKDEIPKDVKVTADDSNPQPDGLPQGDMSDEQAAMETVRQFLQTMINKDYNKIPDDYNGINVVKIISIGTPILQPKWIIPAFKVPCELEIIDIDGQKTICKPNAYAGPEDLGSHTYVIRCIDWLGRSDTTVDGRGYIADLLADNNEITPKQAAEVFFKACAEEDWDEFLKFMPALDEKQIEQVKEYLGGLEIISIGEPFKMGEFPGWYVPYKIRLKNGLMQDWDIKMRNDNPVKRYVFDGGL
jgi:hypothetical protein